MRESFGKLLFERTLPWTLAALWMLVLFPVVLLFVWAAVTYLGVNQLLGLTVGFFGVMGCLLTLVSGAFEGPVGVRPFACGF